MQTITLHRPGPADRDELLAFELSNRQFFERWINARPAQYYSRDGVAAAIALAQQEAEQDCAYQYLVRENGKLVARVNLTQVKRAHYHSATLGYRVGAADNGRGIARQAVGLLLQLAFQELALARVEATCRPENPASIHVLRSNGFSQFGHARRAFELDGQWFDLLHFEVHTPANQAASALTGTPHD